MKFIENKKDILSLFPKIAPSYQNIPNKKVPSIYMAIPMGQKSYIWFTYYKDKPICFILELTPNKNGICNIYSQITCFNEQLCLGSGTILYGTYSVINKFNNFIIEDIYFYKGKSIIKYTFSNRLNCITQILDNFISSQIFTQNQIIFSLPLINNNCNLLHKSIENSCIYKVYNILQKTLYNNYVNEIRYYNSKKITLNISADNQNDIYNLYTYNNDFIGIACINDYKTSVMMNTIFRNIKENERLDSLEESDDEVEFENINLDKYIINKEFVRMECIFNIKFRKWIPIKISKNPVVSNKQEVLNKIR
jgi:hypothetical protein